MIRINLLPYRQEGKKKNVKQQLLGFLIFLIVLIGGLFYLHLHFAKKIENLNTQIAKTQKELDKQNKIAKQVEEYRKKLAELERKLDVIDLLESNKKDTFNILDKLTDCVVKSRMWFTNLKTKEKTTGKGDAAVSVMSISVEGIAMDQTTVADFITNLETEKLFTGVTLLSINKEEVKNGLALQRFRVEFNRRPLEKKQKETEDKKAKEK